MMDAVLLTLRLLLAGVFAVSGAAKLADRAGSRQAMTDFGVPRVLAAPLGLGLPLVELLIAALLLPAATALWGALGATALLLAFIAAIGANLARGRRPNCHCFGQLHSTPIGGRLLLRNSVLAALAAWMSSRVHQSAGLSFGDVLGSLASAPVEEQFFVLLFAVVQAGLGWGVYRLWHQNRRLMRHVSALEQRAGGEAEESRGLEVGAPAPDFELPSLAGGTRSLDDLLGEGRRVLLIFTNPRCGPCTALMPTAVSWQREHAHEMTLALISRGSEPENRHSLAPLGFDHILLQQDREVAEAYQAPATPSAVMLRPDGTIASPLMRGAAEIEKLVSLMLIAPPQPDAGRGASQ